MADNLISEVLGDVRALRAIAQASVPITEPALQGVWRWFIDVELLLPLPVMPLGDAERETYATDILNEMDAIFTRMEAQYDLLTEEQRSNLNTSPDSIAVNALWRELAGVYAPIINRSVTVLSDEERETAHEHALEMLCTTSGMDEDEMRDRIRHDPTLRLMLRRSGLDPDKVR